MKTVSALKLMGVILLVIAVWSGFSGCDGPQGPEGPRGLLGPAGPQGDQGINPSDQCGTCHNVSTTILAKQKQYQQSQHFLGTAYPRASSATCAPCHSNEGFRQKIAGETVTGQTDPTPVNCRTCHNIHTGYTAADFALSTEAPVLLTGVMPTTEVVDIGKGNLCANCHQTRPSSNGLSVGGPNVNITSTHWGPHYGTQSNILSGNSGFEIAGSLSYTNSAHTTAADDGCVTCHTMSHDLKPTVNSCKVCHSTAANFDINGVQTEIEALADTLHNKLMAAGLADEEGHAVVKSDVTSAQAGALMNYLLIHSDGSHGVHNKNYTKALLQNSIEVFAP